MRKHLLITSAALAVLGTQALAHRQWMLPSATVLSVKDGWVTVDAAVSNELFYFDHVPLRLNNLTITAPDRTIVQPENASTGKYRSTFDIHLTQSGTYRVALVNDTAFATWKENGEAKNWRGPVLEMAKAIPPNAESVQTSRMNSRVELFVTSGKPTTEALQPTGAGLEMAPITHPNDLIAGEPASFQLLLHGKPVVGLAVTVIPGGIRYRDQLQEIQLTTDAEGKFTVKFPAAGMYWLNVASGVAGRGPGVQGGSGGPGGPRPPAGDRASYTATLEVLPQ